MFRKIKNWWLRVLWGLAGADKELLDVAAFHHKFGVPINTSVTEISNELLRDRVNFILEEFSELIEDAGLQLTYDIDTLEVHPHNPKDLPGIADALIDLVYVIKGTALILGLPWEELWDDVHRANMQKVRYEDETGHKFGIGKPDGWQPPQTVRILMKDGW